MGSSMDQIMNKRLAKKQEDYQQQWDEGRGSHHPDYDPYAFGANVTKADRVTEELYNCIVENDIRGVYDKIDEGADVNFVFGVAYKCPQGYTPLMTAAHRGRYECCKALLRSGADPNFKNLVEDLSIFWAVDGGVDIIKLFINYGADLDLETKKGWTPLSYAACKGKYGATEEKGIYPEDVLKFYGASRYGRAPQAAPRSPRESFNPQEDNFMRERGSYQNPFEQP
eukprot:TRINITY_DN13985_c0_g1_i3.p1 TRINITY_DN13985_c0_g1~~TRINITY_DN13985_c0_g1_i3.p1  ORF type:complete len:244 (+),score=37.56 TRINITY_DN13985_c0_g1_i3:55-732(+)